MTDAKKPTDTASGHETPGEHLGLVAGMKAFMTRLRDWLSIQTLGTRFAVLAVALLIPASAFYAWSTLARQEKMALEVKAMAVAAPGSDAAWTYNNALPVVFGSGSVLSFLETQPVKRITIIYRPILWTVSERFVLIESEGRQYAYYPSDMETKILADKAVTAPWGGKLTFVPRSALDSSSQDMLARLEQRFGDARPQSEQDAWKGSASALVSGTLTLGLIAFLWFQMGGQRKALKFIAPTQIRGDLQDLVGMDDIKAEVAQIR
ncbi:MAG: AAA family ATPase, partial [Polaromonas sp.]